MNGGDGRKLLNSDFSDQIYMIYADYTTSDFNPFETKTKVVETFDEPGDELPAKGAYNVDFDKFDDPNFNPFETKTKVVENFDPQQQTDDPEPGDEMMETSFEAEKQPEVQETIESTEKIEETQEQPQTEPEEPLPPKGAYNVDFDRFDDPNFNPFETKTKVVEKFDEPEEEPPAPKGAYDIDYSKFDDPNFNPFETKTKVVDNFDTNASEPQVPDETANQEPGDELNELNTGFEPPKRAPPKLGKNRKPVKKKPNIKPKEPEPKVELEPKTEPEDEPPPPKGAYDIDYSKFDDPNFNPFETKTKIVEKFDEPGDEEPLPAKGAYNVDFDKFDDPSKFSDDFFKNPKF